MVHPDEEDTAETRLARLILALRSQGVSDASVLHAIETTPREIFTPDLFKPRAFEDSALPIACGQTISQPFIVGLMTQALKLDARKSRVLEIGTGSGYQTVLLSHLVAQIFTIERIPALYTMAREAIARAGAKNVSMLLGDGTVGWREYAPYDAILVSAGSPSVPQPLVEQLADGGRMLVPVGPMEEQTLKLVTRHGASVETRDVAPVRFVPLYGSHGWEQQ
jgi:protein-L-isoaspartate(D-aspartate) O-methyltransferase